MNFPILIACSLLAGFLSAQERPKPDAPKEPDKRIELNLLGKTDTAAGESRRNENVHFNLVDNNALKELNVRLGVTATIAPEFLPGRGYFGAEFGNAPSPVLHVAAGKSRAGIHGSVYETHQNSIFAARSFFQVGGVQPAHENDYGFTFAAPLWQGAHLFLAGSQQKLRGSVNGNVLVPRPDERTPLATDPAVRSLLTRFLAAYPATLPNRTDVNERALNTNAPQTIDNNNADIRLDQDLGKRDRLFARYSLIMQKVDAFELVAGQNPDTRTRANSARATWNHTWSAATLMDLSAGFDRIRSLLVPEPNAVGPLISISGLQTLGPEGSIPINRAQNLFRYAGLFRQTRGKHSLTAGFTLLRRQLNGVESDAHRGFFSFTNDFGRDSITNFRLGIPTQHIIAIGNVDRGFRNWDMQYFIGDRWQASADLTLTFGLRYQPVTTPVEVNRFNIIPYPCDCNNLAPQFGIARRLKERWGTLRANYGIQYGEIFPVTFQQVRFAPPVNMKIVVPAPDLLNPLATYRPGDPNVLPTTYELDPNLRTPYSHQYNFTWEPAFSRDWRVQLGYVGSRSDKLLIMWYTNRAHPVPGIPQTTATVNLRRADPRFAEIRRIVNGSRGYYDAARVTLAVPRWKGLSLDAAYWFSKAIDLGSSYTNTAFDVDSRLSRSQAESGSQQDMKGLSSFDQPHAFLVHASYAMPAFGMPAFGGSALSKIASRWQVSSIALFKKGTPFDVLSGSDAPGFGNVDANGGDRPNLLDPSILGRTIGNPDTSRALLPRSAFGYMLPGEERGNLGHNAFRKGGICNINAAISRSWTLTGETRLTFRAESINLFNTPQFAAPGTDLVSANFGQITNTLNDGRTFRLTLQFGF